MPEEKRLHLDRRAMLSLGAAAALGAGVIGAFGATGRAPKIPDPMFEALLRELALKEYQIRQGDSWIPDDLNWYASGIRLFDGYVQMRGLMPAITGAEFPSLHALDKEAGRISAQIAAGIAVTGSDISASDVLELYNKCRRNHNAEKYRESIEFVRKPDHLRLTAYQLSQYGAQLRAQGFKKARGPFQNVEDPVSLCEGLDNMSLVMSFTGLGLGLIPIPPFTALALTYSLLSFGLAATAKIVCG